MSRENFLYALLTQRIYDPIKRDYEGQIKHDKRSLLTNQIKFSEVNRLRTLKNSKTEAHPMLLIQELTHVFTYKP